MAKVFKESKPPSRRIPTVMRGDVIVDIPIQVLRIREHCFQEDQEYFGEVEVKGSRTNKRYTSSRCPHGSKAKCEIFQDHKALGLDESLLPCCGAPVPNEQAIVKDGRSPQTYNSSARKKYVYDETEIRQDIADILRTEEIYPLKVEKGE